MKTILIFFFSLLLSTSCIYNKGKDKELERVFTKNDIENINRFVGQFDLRIKDKFEAPDIQNSYLMFFNNLKQVKTVSELEERISFLAPVKKFIYTDMERKTANKIWILSPVINSDQITNIGKINLKGDFIKFLERVSTENKSLKEYYDSIRIAGDISPSSISFLIDNQSDLNVRDEQIRFVIAVHYMSLFK